MTTDPTNSKHIIADEGKILVRKADGTRYGSEIYMGKTYYIGKQRLNPPHTDTIDDFTEIDDPDYEKKEN